MFLTWYAFTLYLECNHSSVFIGDGGNNNNKRAAKQDGQAKKKNPKQKAPVQVLTQR